MVPGAFLSGVLHRHLGGSFLTACCPETFLVIMPRLFQAPLPRGLLFPFDLHFLSIAFLQSIYYFPR